MIEDLDTFAKVVFIVCAFLMFLGFTFMMICSGLRKSKKDNKEKNNDKR